MTRTLLLILALCAPTQAAQVGDAVVIVGGCSGVCIDPAGLVLTVKHCGIPEVTQVKFRDRSVLARKVYETTECDGPVMFDCDGDGFPFVPVASIVPPAGSPVWSAGYPAKNGGRELVWASGKMLGSSRWKNHPRDCGALVNEVNFVASEGWSGGPLFTANNEVCGLLFGGDKRTSFFCSFTAVRTAVDSRQPLQPIAVVDAKPILFVFTSKSCQPCRVFADDYASPGTLRSAIDAAYSVQFVDIDKQPDEAKRRGVTAVPSFVREGKATITGYTTPDLLLVALGLKTESVVERPAIPISTPIAPPVAVQPPASTPTPPAVPPKPTLGDRIDKLTGLVSTGLSVASWLGVTGATGGVAGAVLGGVALWRTFRKVKSAVTQPTPQPVQQPPQVPPAPPTVITTETAPLPQAIVPETRFAAYERDTFAEAFAWAEGQMAQKYPGSVSTLETIRSLMHQYLSAKGIRPTA